MDAQAGGPAHGHAPPCPFLASESFHLKVRPVFYNFLFTRGSPLLLSFSLAAACRLLDAVVSLAAEDRPWGTRASAVAGPGC